MHISINAFAAANCRRKTKHTVIVSLIIVSLLHISPNIEGARGRIAQPPTQRAAMPTLQIMPPDGSAFLVDQRFDIRVEAAAGATGKIQVALDGRNTTEWNNRSYLTHGAACHAPPMDGTLKPKPQRLKRRSEPAVESRHKPRAFRRGVMTYQNSFFFG